MVVRACSGGRRRPGAGAAAHGNPLRRPGRAGRRGVRDAGAARVVRPGPAGVPGGRPGRADAAARGGGRRGGAARAAGVAGVGLARARPDGGRSGRPRGGAPCPGRPGDPPGRAAAASPGARRRTGAAVWLRPPEPGCEAESSLPALSALGGAGTALDLVRLVRTLATQCHRVRLTADRSPRARPETRPMAPPVAGVG